MKNQFLLLKDRRFLPLFITQFTGAFNDNLFKTALSVLVAYGILSTGTWKPEVIVSLTAGFLIFPYVILSPLAGDLADKYDKAKIMRRLKVFELVVITTAVFALLSGSVVFLLIVLFLFGSQAALFAPAKFSILPQQLKEWELIGGNALLNTGTYLAILTGAIIGSVLAVKPYGPVAIGIILTASGVTGYIASHSIPKAPPPSPEITPRINIVAEIINLLRYARAQRKPIFRSILGISWFYFLGATVLAQFPNFTKQVLAADANVLALLMTVFSVGIALGGLLNNRLLKAKVDARLVPLAAALMGVFLVDLYFVKPVEQAGLSDIKTFLASPVHWRVIFDLLVMSMCGGLYVIPLKSLVQHRTRPERRARVMAASAMIDSLFILTSSGLAAGLLFAGFTISQLFLMLAVATFVAAVYLRKQEKTP